MSNEEKVEPKMFRKLVAGRSAQLISYSDLSRTLGVDLTTVQSWLALLEQNGIVRTLQPYYSDLTQRLIKTPKVNVAI